MLNWREQGTLNWEQGTGRMSDINDFKDLIIWQKGMDIAQRCYFLTKLFHKDELYGMVQQIRRSAVSIRC
jgi:hypothetical protein